MLANATRGAKKRSRSHPVKTLPSRLALASNDAKRAAREAVRPRSVKRAERRVIEPFILIELTKRVAVTIQNGEERRPDCQEVPE